MKPFFSAAISLSACLTLLSLWRSRGAISEAFSGISAFLAMTLLAGGSNVVLIVYPEGHRLPGLTVVAVVFCALAALTLQADDIPGGPHRAQRAAWWAYGALVVWFFVVDATVQGGFRTNQQWLSYGCAFAVWLAVGLMAGRRSLQPQAFAFLGAGLLSAMTLPTLFEESFWLPCKSGTFEKCSAAGALYTSYGESENFIAILASFTLIAALTTLTGSQRVLICAQASVVVAATGSRTGIGSLLVAVLVGLSVMALRRRRPSFSPPPWTLAASVAAVAALATRWVWTADREFLSHRGNIWDAVRRPVSDHLTTGLGASKWQSYQEFGESPDHFFHSGYAYALFAGGAIGVALFATWIYFLVRSSTRLTCPALLLATGSLFAVYSLTEVVWNPLAVDGLTWIAASAMAISVSRPVLANSPSHPISCTART